MSVIKWLGREGSNLRMAESKSAALPLGYAPSGPGNGGETSVRRFPRVAPVYRERRGISTARRGKIPRAPVAPRHALYERYASPFPTAAPPPVPTVETSPVSWEYGGKNCPAKTCPRE